MPGEYNWKNRLPVAPLKIIALDGCGDFARAVDRQILKAREENIIDDHAIASSLHLNGYTPETFIMEAACPRFGSGEAKGVIKGSCRGDDVYILADVVNNSVTYSLNGFVNHMSPDDHYTNLKRIVSACAPSAHRINVIMPFLYESRQHKKTSRESLDCAMMLEELVGMGVSNIITFDAHDPRVQNATPLSGLENFMPTFQFVEAIFDNIPITIDKDHLMIISPDEGAMDRAVYLANNLGVDMGMFYKRRDYSKVVNGRNPIVEHAFLGANVEGKTVIIMDDMISSGDSMMDTARELKLRKADKVVICATFGLFTNGLDRFDEAFEKGIIDYVCTTNLNYRPPELKSRRWYLEADMSRYLALIINSINHDSPVSMAQDTTSRIQEYVKVHNSDGYSYIGTLF